MALAKHRIRVVDTAGRALVGDAVTVNVQATGSPATLYSDESYTAKVNPITTDNDGIAWFYAFATDYQYVSAAAGTIQDSTIYDGAAREVTVYKTAPEVVNNSDVLQDDDHLQFTAGRQEFWYMHWMLLVTSNALAGIKTDLLPASAAWGGTQVWILHEALTILTSGMWSAMTTVGHTGGLTDGRLMIHAIWKSGNTEGLMKLQWAQNAPHASATTIATNSYVRARRVG